MAMYYLIGGFFILSLAGFVRYLALYRLGTLAERKRQKASAYDIGDFIKKCRNKNAQKPNQPQGLAQAPQAKPKKSQHKLPIAPVILDSALIGGANVFLQYMSIDNYMYEGLSRMSGKQINNFSDLSSKIKEYAHNSNGLTEGALKKIKGHVAEEHVAAHFESAGAEVIWPESSNQEDWDLLINGNKIQVKLHEDTGALTEHFKEHADIPVVIPSDAENIPNTAFHFDPSAGLESLADFLKETPENAVIVDHQLSHAGLTSATEQATDFATGNIDATFPFITLAFSGFREFRLLRKNDTNILSSAKNIALDVTGTWGGMGAGAATGMTIGSAVFPGVGTAVGGAIGSVAGGLFGRTVANKIKEAPLKKAIETYKKSTRKLKRKTRQTEKKYESQFQLAKEQEQQKLKDLAYETKKSINEKTKELRKWTAEKEKPSKSLRAGLLNNVLSQLNLYRKEHNPNWMEWFWPKQETINRQIKINNIKKFIIEEFKKNKSKDRGQMFQKFAEQGLCRDFIFSEIQKIEEERLSRENNLIKEITKRHKQVLRKRSQSIKNLANKTKDYALKIREELSPCLKEVKSCQNHVKKEAKKLGRKAA